jgi:hypothetical protein
MVDRPKMDVLALAPKEMMITCAFTKRKFRPFSRTGEVLETGGGGMPGALLAVAQSDIL